MIIVPGRAAIAAKDDLLDADAEVAMIAFKVLLKGELFGGGCCDCCCG